MEGTEPIRQTRSPASRRWLAMMVLVGAGAALLLLHGYHPSHKGLIPKCPFFALTGGYCPGCGTLRGLHHLLNGRVAAAFSYNPLAMLFLPLAAYALLDEGLILFRGRRLRVGFLPSWLTWGALGLIILYWVLRNIPRFPFNLLAPG